MVRFRGRLDHLLDHHLDRGLSGVSPRLVDLLRLGAYQLLRMGGVPAYAAVSETVDEARRVEGRGAAGLVNAVLRAVADAGEDPALFPDPGEAPVEHLATWGSHPAWLLERWLSRWDFEEVRDLVEANNRVPPLTVVPLRTDPEGAVTRLAERGIEARPVEGTPAVEVESGDPGTVLATVDAVVQDPAASLVARYAAPPEAELVADLCAAPGGKALDRKSVV